jgi:hypothetical protein
MSYLCQISRLGCFSINFLHNVIECGMHFETANYLCKLAIFIDLQGPGIFAYTANYLLDVVWIYGSQICLYFV